MNNNIYVRKQILKAVIVVFVSLFMLSCGLISELSTKKQKFTFVQICDTQLGFGGYDHDIESFNKAVEQVNAINPDFVVICGDLVNEISEKSIADFLKIKEGFNMPCYCVSGNHDVGNEPTPFLLKTYREYIGKDYYSFRHKGYRFVIVNTQLWKSPLEAETEKQDLWLEATLKSAAKRKSRIFIVGHHPLFLSDPDEDNQYYNLPVDKRKELLAMFEKYGVVGILGGHTHKLYINDYKGIQLVNAETVSRNFDKRPLGFRVWHIDGERPFKHEFISLKNSKN